MASNNQPRGSEDVPYLWQRYLDSLIGFRWEVPSGPLTLKYYFSDILCDVPWTEAGKKNARAAFDAYSKVIDVRFAETSTVDDAQFEMGMFSSDKNGATGKSGFPEPNKTRLTMRFLAPRCNVERDLDSDEFGTFLHETGHALGLRHSDEFPGTGGKMWNSGSNHLSQRAYTVMSYVRGWAVTDQITRMCFPTGPMAFDIAALQVLYGKNLSTGAGNDTYLLSDQGNEIRCLWDAAGVDEIAYRGNLKAHISLQAATLDNSPTGGGVVSYLSDNANNIVGSAFTIANGVVIENASGGRNDDVIAGNASNNQLSGNAGNDTLEGGDGDDTLDGGFGADRLIGGRGNDTYIVDNKGDTITENANEGIDTVRSSMTYTLGNHLEYLVLTGNLNIDGRGNALNNRLTGNNANNVLNGDAGDDTLDGGGGTDTLIGGDGNDTLITRDALANATDRPIQAMGDAGEDLFKFLGVVGSARIDGGTGNDWLDFSASDEFRASETGALRYRSKESAGVYIDLNAGSGRSYDTRSATAGSPKFEGGILTIANIENLRGTQQADRLLGDSRANVIDGQAGDDLIDGQGGADTMIGGTGNDTYVVDDLQDVVIETSTLANELDDVQSSISYTLGANLERLVLTGTAAINGTGNDQRNLLQGNAAGNVLNGGRGADTMIGGAGNDVYVVDDLQDVVIETSTLASEKDSVQSSVSHTLGANLEMLFLTGGSAINGTGNDQNNWIQGNAAGNILNGGIGADTMSGGAGNDIYYVDSAGDVVIEMGQNPTEIDYVIASVSFSLGDNYGNNLETLILAGNDAINGTGNIKANRIDGNVAANLLSGLLGDDSLSGMGGNDTLSGGAGNDSMDGGDGNDLMFDGDGNDTVRGGDGDDRISTSLGWECNSFNGGAGNDTLSYDAVAYPYGRGSPSNDTGVWVDLSSNKAWRYGIDTKYYDGIPDDVHNIENVIGSDLRDKLLGDAGNNTLNGGKGNDTIAGGLGSDVLTGGSGADWFLFNEKPNSQNVDRITDFNAAEHDVIALDSRVFTKLARNTNVSEHFRTTKQAVVGNDDYLVYDSASGQLYYDESGNGNGLWMHIATLQGEGRWALDGRQFVVI